jgi:hypothetical protein
VKREFDNFVIYVQKYIDETLRTRNITVKSRTKPIEAKMETLDWAVRFSDFISSEELQKFFFGFRELYANPDPNVRNLYI